MVKSNPSAEGLHSIDIADESHNFKWVKINSGFIRHCRFWTCPHLPGEWGWGGWWIFSCTGLLCGQLTLPSPGRPLSLDYHHLRRNGKAGKISLFPPSALSEKEKRRHEVGLALPTKLTHRPANVVLTQAMSLSVLVIQLCRTARPTGLSNDHQIDWTGHNDDKTSCSYYFSWWL